MANSSGYKGISRIDSENKNTYGWYVRVTFRCQTFSKFFSDSVHGGRDKALARAVRYRNSMEREIGKPRTDRTVATTNPRNRTGVLGVKRVEKGPGGAYEVTWSPEPNVIRRTTVSVRKFGEDEAFRRACSIRQRYEREMYGGLVKRDEEEAAPATKGRRGRSTAAALAAGAQAVQRATTKLTGKPGRKPAGKTAKPAAKPAAGKKVAKPAAKPAAAGRKTGAAAAKPGKRTAAPAKKTAKPAARAAAKPAAHGRAAASAGRGRTAAKKAPARRR